MTYASKLALFKQIHLPLCTASFVFSPNASPHSEHVHFSFEQVACCRSSSSGRISTVALGGVILSAFSLLHLVNVKRIPKCLLFSFSTFFLKETVHLRKRVRDDSVREVQQSTIQLICPSDTQSLKSQAFKSSQVD